MATDLEKLLEQVESLPADQRQRLRQLLDADTRTMPIQTAEDEFKQRLLKRGLISEIKRPSKNSSSTPRRRADIQDKPLSETVIEERR